MTSTTDPAALNKEPTPGPRLFSRRYLPLAAGIISLVTLGAFENRAVVSVMPTAVRALDGLAWFGPANAAPLITFLVAVALAGRWVDRKGPRAVLLLGLATFLVAQAATATAPHMAVFILGRGLSGVAEGLLDVSLLVFAARALPEALRAKVFATFAAAWIMPSLLGPVAAGAVATWLGWRVAFVLPLALLVPAVLLVRPSLNLVGPADTTDSEPGSGSTTSTISTVVLAGAVALLSIGSSVAFEAGGSTVIGLTLLVGGAITLPFSVVRALPAGTLRLAPGVPAIVGLRMVVVVAFTGMGSYLPLMLDVTRDAGPAVAGLSLSVTGVFWAVGSALHSTDFVQQRYDAAARVRTGLSLIAVGGLAVLALAVEAIGLVAGMAGWALAGIGMGMTSPSLATELFALVAPSEQGRATSASQIAASLGTAIATTAGGALVAARSNSLNGKIFAVIIAAAVSVAVVGTLFAGRIRTAKQADGAAGALPALAECGTAS